MKHLSWHCNSSYFIILDSGQYKWNCEFRISINSTFPISMYKLHILHIYIKAKVIQLLVIIIYKHKTKNIIFLPTYKGNVNSVVYLLPFSWTCAGKDNKGPRLIFNNYDRQAQPKFTLWKLSHLRNPCCWKTLIFTSLKMAVLVSSFAWLRHLKRLVCLTICTTHLNIFNFTSVFTCTINPIIKQAAK